MLHNITIPNLVGGFNLSEKYAQVNRNTHPTYWGKAEHVENHPPDMNATEMLMLATNLTMGS